jgi:hypothetical protein
MVLACIRRLHVNELLLTPFMWPTDIHATLFDSTFQDTKIPVISTTMLD